MHCLSARELTMSISEKPSVTGLYSNGMSKTASACKPFSDMVVASAFVPFDGPCKNVSTTGPYSDVVEASVFVSYDGPCEKVIDFGRINETELASGRGRFLVKVERFRGFDDDVAGMEISSLSSCRIRTVELEATAEWGKPLDIVTKDIISNELPVKARLAFHWNGRIYLKIAYQRNINCDCVSCEIDPSLSRSRFRNLFSNPDSSDVVVRIGDEEFPAHKAVLSAKVPFYKRLFRSGMREAIANRIKIDVAEEPCFKEVLEYVYCGQLPRDLNEDPMKYLPTADMKEIDDLKVACWLAMEREIRTDNLVEILIIAHLYRCPYLKKSCLKRKEWLKRMRKDALEPLKVYPELMMECFRLV